MSNRRGPKTDCGAVKRVLVTLDEQTLETLSRIDPENRSNAIRLLCKEHGQKEPGARPGLEKSPFG